MTYRFFLGGRDLEMAEIRRLLHQHAPGLIEDKHLRWGAKASDYQAELARALDRGETPVLIELAEDLPADLLDPTRVVVVDHHGARAGADRTTSIEQVFTLLRLPSTCWTRRLELVAVNDRAHVKGLKAAGASLAEIAELRTLDRAEQGVTIEDEREAQRAILTRRVVQRLTIVETTSATSSAIADQMLPELGGPGYLRLLVAMPEQAAVFADGPAIVELANAYPGGWWGGALPEAGFWGMSWPVDRRGTLAAVVDLLR